MPRLVRWRYKMEAGELLKVNVSPFSSENYQQEEFFAKMTRDGHLTVPKLTMEVLAEGEKENLAGCIFEVSIRPVEGWSNDAGTFK